MDNKTYKADLSIEVSQEEFDALEHVFNYHAPTEDSIKLFERNRQVVKMFAALLLRSCPRSPELTTAITKLEEAMFWSNAAIARGQNAVSA